MNRRTFFGSAGLSAIGASWLAARRLRSGASHTGQRSSSSFQPTDVRRVAETEQDVGWPQRLGPDGHCVASETGLIDSFPNEGPTRLWQRKIGTGYSSPVISDNKLILLHRVGDEELVECFDSESGEPLWRNAAATAFQSQYPDYSSGPYSSPLITESRVFAWGAEGLFRCLDLVSGELIWQRNLRDDFNVPPSLFAVGSSPCLDGHRLILNVGGTRQNAGVVAVDVASGETLWHNTDHGASYATPVVATIHGLRLAFVFTTEGVVCLDAASGGLHWFIKFGVGNAPERVNAVSPLVWNDLLLLTSGPGPGNLCVRVLPDGSYERVWKAVRAIDSQFNNQICLDGFVYGYTSKWNRSASLVCVDIRNGDVRWTWASDLLRGSGLAADGKLILLGENGHLAMLDANPNEPIIRVITPKPLLRGPTYASPALFSGRLFVRNEQELVCYDLRR